MFARVLFPTDFSDPVDAAFQVVKRLKAAGTREVIVLHVQDDSAMIQCLPEQLIGMIRSVSKRLASR